MNATDGTLLFVGDGINGEGRTVSNEKNNYRTICSSVIIALFEDRPGSTKAELMRRYLSFLGREDGGTL